jgi:hypothetical protein
VLGLDFVHDRKAICLEGTRRHLLHTETPLEPWSLYHGQFYPKWQILYPRHGGTLPQRTSRHDPPSLQILFSFH